MGLELLCRARIEDEEVEGKLHLDSKELRFVGGGYSTRWVLPLGPGIKMSDKDGWLCLAIADYQEEFELAGELEKWRKKILNPPGIRQKLGLKPGMRVWVDGEPPVDLEGCEEVGSIEAADLGLLILGGREDLGRFLNLAGTDRPVWVIYPKGGKMIREAEVMEIAQQMGMGASKTAAVNERLTGMRFMRKKQ